MSGPQDKMEKLRSFGLSEYASRAYLALLELGTTEARDVSRLAKIPLAKVYSTLEQLQEKGLVVVTPETPKKYAPVPFGEFIDRIRGSHEERARELAAVREDLSAEFPILGTTEMGDRGGVITIRGRRNVLEKLRDLAAGCSGEALLAGSMGMLGRKGHLRPMLEQAHARGVHARLVAPEGAPAERLADLSAFCEVRLRPAEQGQQALHVATAIFDRRVALMAHFIPDDDSTLSGKDMGLVVDECALVQALQGFAEHLWARATPLPPPPARRVASLAPGLESR